MNEKNKMPASETFTLSINDALKKGYTLFKTGRYYPAKDIFIQILKQIKNEPHCLVFLYYIFRAMDDKQPGINEFFKDDKNCRVTYIKVIQFLKAMKDYKMAHFFWDDIIKQHPQCACFHMEKGLLYSQDNHNELALICYKNAVTVNPQYIPALVNLGALYQAQDQCEKALQSYQQAEVIEPANPDILRNLGSLYRRMGVLDKSIEYLEKALVLRPNYLEAKSMLVSTRRRAYHWEHWQNDTAWIMNEVRNIRIEKGFYVPTFWYPLSLDEQLRWINGFAQSILENSLSINEKLQRPARQSFHKTIRLGYLSADFRAHATTFLLRRLFQLHDRERFTVYAYSFGANDDTTYRKGIETDCDYFHDIQRLTDETAAQLILNDEIDILIDLMGYTYNSRSQLTALRLAPVQVNYLGFPSTMGGHFMDYIMVDPYVVPENKRHFYSETCAYLPTCYQISDDQRLVSTAPSRKECGLPEDGLVFCCFCNSYKLDPETFQCWLRLLKAVPNSVLWLYERYSVVVTYLRNEAKKMGIDPQRLVFAKPQPIEQHLARHVHADIFLDTLLVNGHTTANDALWMDVPVITCSGDTFASRVAGSLLHGLDCDECIAVDLAEYEALALSLAQHPEKRLAIKNKIQKNRRRVFETASYVAAYEDLLQQMWQRWKKGLAPKVLFSGQK